MKNLKHFCLLLALVASLTGFAHANGIHAVIVDPPLGPNGYELDPGDSSVPSSAFNFGACSVGETAQIVAALGTSDSVGCFLIVNYTGGPITSVTVSFTGPTAVFGDNSSISCSGLFGSIDCGESSIPNTANGLYTLTFVDPTKPIANGSSLVIGESLPTTDFNGVLVGAQIISATPEPSSVALLGTGLLAGAGMLVARRRMLHLGNLKA